MMEVSPRSKSKATTEMARIALRLQRSGLIGMSAFGIFYGVFQASAYISAAGSTVAGRAAFGRQMELFGRQFTTLLPVPQHVETLSGYLQWRVYGALPLLFGFWAVMSATGATRGDEDKQLVEMWLGSAVSRVGYVVTRFLLFAAAAVISIALTSAAIDGGAARAGSPLDLGAAVGELLALLALTLVVYALSMAAAQLAASRTAAAGMAGGLVLALFFINSSSRTAVNLQPLARVVSPFYYFDRSNGLVPGGSLDITGTVALLTLSLLLTALTVWLMTVRDIGSPLVARPRRQGPVTHLPASNPLLRVPVIEALYEHRTGLALWVVGASGLAAYYASIARTIVDVITGPGSSGFR